MKKVALVACMVLCFFIVQDRCSNPDSNSTVQNQITNRTSATKRNELADLCLAKKKNVAIHYSPVQSNAEFISEPFLSSINYSTIPTLNTEADKNIQEFLAIRNAPTETEIFDATKFVTIRGRQGTTLQFIPSTFKINDSTFYNGEVKIEMKEVKKQSQMVFSNFSTTTDGQLLESAGMIYWKATTVDGEPLLMDTSSSVLATFYGSRKFDDYQLFTAQPTFTALNWQLYPSNLENVQLAIMPADLMPLKAFRINFKYQFLPEETVLGWNDRLAELTTPYYQNTSLCSYEFLQRLEVIRNMGWDLDVLDYYLENPNSINTADSLAIMKMLDYGDNISRSNFKISKKNLCASMSKKMWLKVHLRKFRSFFLESRSFNNTVSVTKKDLHSIKNLTKVLSDEQYATWLMAQPNYKYNFSRCDEFVDTREWTTRRINTAVVQRKNFKFITLRIPQMGYINCDRFLDNPIRRNVLVKINNAASYDAVYSYLLFKSYNSVMQGSLKDSSSVSFTGVPAGMKVYLILIGTRNDETFYTQKEIMLVDDVYSDAELKPTAKEEIECLITQLAG